MGVSASSLAGEISVTGTIDSVEITDPGISLGGSGDSGGTGGSGGTSLPSLSALSCLVLSCILIGSLATCKSKHRSGSDLDLGAGPAGCAKGRADGYPCNNVSLAKHVSLSTLGVPGPALPEAPPSREANTSV